MKTELPTNTYWRVIRLLDDGRWHGEDELREVTTFPEHWVRELIQEGHEVAETATGDRLVRLSPAAR